MPEGCVEKLFSIIDRKRSTYIEVLKDAVSVNSNKSHYEESTKLINWAEERLKNVGASTTQHGAGELHIGNGKRIKLPPILSAEVKSERASSTVLVYGHLDVKPSSDTRRASTNSEKSLTLTEEDGVLFGSGVVDSKGPLLCWLNAVEAYQDLNVCIPVNISFVIEAMRESGKDALVDYVDKHKGSLFKNVSCICISDSSCLSTPKPVITYGLRGCCKFEVTVRGANCNLHSGVHGGMVSEPMVDMLHLMSSLVNTKGEILIPNFRSDVEDVTPEEEKAYHKLTFDVDAFKKSIGVERLLHKDQKKRLLMHRSRFPSLSVHGIRSENEVGDDQIPSQVKAYFTIRIVPHQNPQDTFHKVQQHLTHQFSKLQSPNEMKIEMPVGIEPWVANTNDSAYKAASNAVKRVYKQDPELIREGSSIPIVRHLQDVSGKTVLLLPVGCSDHSVTKNRDRIDVKNFMEGTKVIASFIYELTLLKRKK